MEVEDKSEQVGYCFGIWFLCLVEFTGINVGKFLVLFDDERAQVVHQGNCFGAGGIAEDALEGGVVGLKGHLFSKIKL